MQETTTLIIGGSISGLASAAALQKKGIPYIIIEKEEQVASPWRRHYDRLHLHTSKKFSHLPYKKFGASISGYPSRKQVIEYLEDYQKIFNIGIRYHTKATSVRKDTEGWITETSNGTFHSSYVVMATGAFSKSKPIMFSGMETFPGKLVHSFEYKCGSEYKGMDVLVVGFGNSACEIAIDLYEQGAMPSMAVRSPVNIIPRDVLGIPVLQLSLLLNRLPPRVADFISAPLVNALTGNIGKLGLKQMPYGPLEQIQKDGKAPVLDIGTLKHIRQGHIQIYKGIDRIENNTVYFEDGKSKAFDAVIAAIGYHRDFAALDAVDKSRFADLQFPLKMQKSFGKDGLYFCGYWISPTGQIREIGKDALLIAGDIAGKEKRH